MTAAADGIGKASKLHRRVYLPPCLGLSYVERVRQQTSLVSRERPPARDPGYDRLVFRFGHINLAVFFHLTQPVLLQMESTAAGSRASENVASMIARGEGAFSLSMKARRSHGSPRRT
jgi:hypothetical protein